MSTWKHWSLGRNGSEIGSANSKTALTSAGLLALASCHEIVLVAVQTSVVESAAHLVLHVVVPSGKQHWLAVATVSFGDALGAGITGCTEFNYVITDAVLSMVGLQNSVESRDSRILP